MSDGMVTRIGTILNGTASGLFPMAIFTPVYAVWPLVAWTLPGLVFFLLAAAWSVYLAVSAARLRRLGRELPHETNAEDARITKGMAIVSGVQGGLIVVSAILLAVLGQWRWIGPVIVLIVALHFFTMPWIFHRTIDYWLGSVMLLVAAVGLYLSAQDAASWQTTWAVVGIGAAAVTSSYGLWILLTARRVLHDYETLPAA